MGAADAALPPKENGFAAVVVGTAMLLVLLPVAPNALKPVALESPVLLLLGVAAAPNANGALAFVAGASAFPKLKDSAGAALFPNIEEPPVD